MLDLCLILFWSCFVTSRVSRSVVVREFAVVVGEFTVVVGEFTEVVGELAKVVDAGMVTSITNMVWLVWLVTIP